MSQNPQNPFFQGDDKPRVEQVAQPSPTARVPDKVARGVYSTGQVILDSPKEFMIDFLQALTKPQTIVARVVMTPQTMFEFRKTLEENLGGYTRNFGAPPPPPVVPNERRLTIQEVYETFRLPEEIMGGAYCNSVLIGHSTTEFVIDFISGFYPTNSVSSRIYMSAQQIPRFLTTLTTACEQFQKRYTRPPENPPTGQP